MGIHYVLAGKCVFFNRVLLSFSYLLILLFRYYKPCTSMRLINYHSHVPEHELVNTFTMRVVVASRYDSGGSILRSYHRILEEMWANSLPRRMMQACLFHTRKYCLGRNGGSKRLWLRMLSDHIYKLKIGSVSYEEFHADLWDKLRRGSYVLGQYKLEDDVSLECALKVHSKRELFKAGDPKISVIWRGKQSRNYHKMLRSKYPRCFATVSHPRQYSLRRLTHGKVKRGGAVERMQKYMKLKSVSRSALRKWTGLCVE